MLGLLVVLQTQASHPFDLRAEERHVRDTVNMLYTAFTSGAQPPAILVEKKQHHVSLATALPQQVMHTQYLAATDCYLAYLQNSVGTQDSQIPNLHPHSQLSLAVRIYFLHVLYRTQTAASR